jgi:hypothetical protein
MKENMYQPVLAAWHSLPCFAFLSLHLYKANLPQTARIIRSTASKLNHSIEKQSFSAPLFWRYPIIVVYKRLAYLQGMLFSLLLNYSKLNCYGV